MDKLEVVQIAIRQLGDVSAKELSTFIEKEYDIKIEARFMPVFRASIREKERLEAIRQAARAAVAQAKAEQAARAAADPAA